MKRVEKFPLSPPSLDELAAKLKTPLSENYEHSSVSVEQCPDLRQPPFNLATEGLSGDEKISEIGGQSNLFPQPRLDNIWSMTDIAKAMEMSPDRGSLIGAGAGPYRDVGQNCELVTNYSWKGGFENNVQNGCRYARVTPKTGKVEVHVSPTLNFALMMNLFGSRGEPGPVLKITARKRTGSQGSLTECIQAALHAAYGSDAQDSVVSLGGVVLVKKGTVRYHVMPDFPPEKDLPFKDIKQLEDWLTFHNFKSPIIGMTVLHSADPDGKMGLRMEHTHTFSPTGADTGGHYHNDVEDPDGEDVEYEAYFNTAKIVYRVDRPADER